MMRLWRNPRVLLIVLGVAALVAIAAWPRAIVVETGMVRRAPLVVTLDEDGSTRVRNRFVIAAPVTGEVRRISLEPGARVAKGAVVAVIRPAVAPPLDSRARAEATAALEAAGAARSRLDVELGRARTARVRTAQQVARTRSLAEAGAVAREELEARQSELDLADAAVRAAEFALAQAQSEADVARARLAPAGDATRADLDVVAPVSGVILKRHHESQSVVPAGEPLLEIGDPDHLEIVADFLSADAVRVRPGQAVSIEQWGGAPLRGRVRLVEPSAFTRISALGVEEQRVNVLIDFEADGDGLQMLGDNFRVEVRVILSERDHVLTVPLGSLFRQQEAWAVYVVTGHEAHVRTIEIGERTRLDAEVVSGLDEGMVVVLYPPDTLSDGARIDVRQK